MWCIECIVEEDAGAAFIPVLECCSTAVSFFEHTHADRWLLQALYDAKPNIKELQAQVTSLAKVKGLTCPFLKLQPLPEVDWLTENYKSFPPLEIGRFFIYGSHYQGLIPLQTRALQIDAATAFGTGEHATTHDCLAALEEIALNTSVSKAIDLGCGSGILAMAMTLLWPEAEIFAVDHDLEAVRVAKENCKINQIKKVKCLISEGLNVFAHQKKFDLIAANILMEPLCHMAENISRHLTSKGYLLLSGILSSQIKIVLHTYQAVGLQLKKQYLKEGWATLTFTMQQGDKSSL